MVKLIAIFLVLVFFADVALSQSVDPTVQQRRAALRAAMQERPRTSAPPAGGAAPSHSMGARERALLRQQLRLQRGEVPRVVP